MRFALATTLFLAAAACCMAEDFTLADGSTLREVRVQRQSADELYVLHAEGARRIRYDQLSPELQQRFGMTPQQVEAHRAALEQEVAERRRARARQEEYRLSQLRESGSYPRYLEAEDVQRLLAPLETVSARESAYLAAEWNRAEAERKELEASVQLFAAERDDAKADFDAAQDARRQQAAEQQRQREELERARQQLSATQAEIARLHRECERLHRENNTLWNSRSNTTIVMPSRPILIPAVRRSAPPCPPGDHRHGSGAGHGARPLPPHPGGGAIPAPRGTIRRIP